MLAGACPGECSRNTHDVAVAGFELICQIDLVASRVLEERVKAGDDISNIDHGTRCGVEASGQRRTGQSDTAEGCTESHFEMEDGRERVA